MQQGKVGFVGRQSSRLQLFRKHPRFDQRLHFQHHRTALFQGTVANDFRHFWYWRRTTLLRRKEPSVIRGTPQAQCAILLFELSAADGRPVLLDALDQSVGHHRYWTVGSPVDVCY